MNTVKKITNNMFEQKDQSLTDQTRLKRCNTTLRYASIKKGDVDGESTVMSLHARHASGMKILMQELMTSTLELGGSVFVFDVGHNFEQLCRLLGGQFVDITLKPRPGKSFLCVNPFVSIASSTKEEEKDALAMLHGILCTMALPTTGGSDLERAMIAKAMYEAFYTYRQATTMSKIVETLNSYDDELSKKLASMFYPYTKDGMYGKFFDGKSNVDFNNPLVVVELDELQERQDLQSIVLQMMILSITNKIFLEGGSQAPFIIILGESSNMLRGPYSGVLIDMLSRRIRKYNGYLYVGARLVNDF